MLFVARLRHLQSLNLSFTGVLCCAVLCCAVLCYLDLQSRWAEGKALRITRAACPPWRAAAAAAHLRAAAVHTFSASSSPVS